MGIRNHKKEAIRWLNAPDGTKVWYRHGSYPWKWELTNKPTWDEELIYIVNDEQAEIRKKWIDRGKPPMQHFGNVYGNDWYDIDGEPEWDLNINYRFKPLEWYGDPDMVGKPIWVKDGDGDRWLINIFVGYDENSKFKFKTPTSRWKHAKPVTCDEVYKGKSNEEPTTTQS